ncbi:MAG TPA: PEP-CTERM sorting domain-containing protein [Gemmatimonadaceae bacterium]|jgi:hypothetical protein|nr:PEP-CTERM sorting domain-containing protein [Gemmatimonadaceae bacterium]
MQQSRFAFLAGSLALMTATAAAAQNNVQLTQPNAPGGGAVTAFGYYMSPYTGTVNGVTERLNCVDFFHDVSIGEQWTATITNLGAAAQNLSLLSATRDGSSGGYSSLADVLKMYEEAAWLTNQYGPNPALNPDRAVAIQTAIWSIVDNGPTNPSSLQYASTGDYWDDGHQTASIVDDGTGSTGYWINEAETEYKLQSDTYYDEFNLLSGTGAVGSGAQEFIYSSATPEPGTFVLIGTGLAGMAGAVRLRRRKRGAQFGNGEAVSAIDAL